MKKEYAKHDEEFKKMIVNLCETNKDKTMSDIAREYGLTRTSITQWRKKYGTITTSTGETTSNDEILKLKKRITTGSIGKWNLKKSSSHILKRTEYKIKFINDNKHKYDIRLMCKCLDIHHSVYYYHCNHQMLNN